MAVHRLGRGLASVLVVSILACAAGCARYGIIDDGSSVSFGPTNRGKLMNPAQLPVRGDGYLMPRRWATRGLHYGTDELVALIVDTARHIHALRPGALLGIADLSPRRGGPSAWHRSHQTGRDVDLLFFVKDAAGQPVVLEAMVHFQADGTAVITGSDGAKHTVYFDVDKNWLLVRSLLDSALAQIQYLFIYEPLKQLLLDHARATGESDAIIEQASYLLHQPGDALPHDDHLHLRVYCSAEDRELGCLDRGTLRWTKKDYKYGAGGVNGGPLVATATLLSPMPAMMVLGALPFTP